MHLVHDNNEHYEFDRFYERFRNYFVKNASKRLKKYIAHCSKCLINQIRRYKLYEQLNLIIISTIFFDIVTFDFMTSLSKYDKKNCNTLLTFICKFSKKILLIVDRDDWNTQQWVYKMINKFLKSNWNISRIWISNKNFKFIEKFWQIVFKKLEIKFKMFTFYHSQTND